MERFSNDGGVQVTVMLDSKSVASRYDGFTSFDECKRWAKEQLNSRYNRGTIFSVSAYQKSTDVYHSANIRL